MSDLKPRLYSLVSSAIELAKSVRDDIKEQRSISDETILALNRFVTIQDQLSEVLDFENIQPMKGTIQ